jgi:hypothetical protein
MTRYIIFPILWVGALSVAAAHVLVGALFGLLPAGVGLAVVDVAAAAGFTWWGVRFVRGDA